MRELQHQLQHNESQIGASHSKLRNRILKGARLVTSQKTASEKSEAVFFVGFLGTIS